MPSEKRFRMPFFADLRELFFYLETKDWTKKDWEEYVHGDDYDKWKDEHFDESW